MKSSALTRAVEALRSWLVQVADRCARLMAASNPLPRIALPSFDVHRGIRAAGTTQRKRL